MSGSGWGWPLNSRKAHYFVDGHSLCGRWLFLGDPTSQPQAMGEKPGPDDCVACWRKVKAGKTA